jgi:hypothetical protein
MSGEYMNSNQGGGQQDMAAMLQQALAAGGGRQQPQNTQQMGPVQPEFGEAELGVEEPVDPVAEIQEQLEAVTAQMDITQDPMELQQLAQVARELQTALEAALQQGARSQDPFAGDPFANGNGGQMPPSFGGGGGF